MKWLITNIAKLVVSLGFVFIVWQGVTGLGWVNTQLFPSPIQVGKALIKMYSDGIFLDDLSISLTRASVGFVLGAVLGVISGLLTARVYTFRLLVYPFFNILRPIPAIALVPVAIVWFGIGEDSNICNCLYSFFSSLAQHSSWHGACAGIVYTCFTHTGGTQIQGVYRGSCARSCTLYLRWLAAWGSSSLS